MFEIQGEKSTGNESVVNENKKKYLNRDSKIKNVKWEITIREFASTNIFSKSMYLFQSFFKVFFFQKV